MLLIQTTSSLSSSIHGILSLPDAISANAGLNNEFRIVVTHRSR